MKMSRGCGYMLLLVVLFIVVVSGVVGDVIKKVGVEARFKSDKTALQESSITWKYSAGGEVIKVVEWDNDFQTEEILNPKFKNRVALDRNNGELTIRNLQLGDSGSYSIEINNKEEKKISLIVKEGVPQPKVIAENTDNDDVKYWTCEYPAKISWNCSDGEKPQIKKLDSPRQGEFIIFTRTKMPDVCCTCTLSNEVSEETSYPLCEKEVFTDSSGGNYWWIIFVVIGICISPFILYIFCDPFRNFVKTYEEISWLKGLIACLESCRNKIRCLGNDKSKKKDENHKKVQQPLQHQTSKTSDEDGQTEIL